MTDSSSDDVTSIVIDNGSYQIKAGFAGDDAPRNVFPAVTLAIQSSRDQYVGDEAQSSRGAVAQNFPIEQGIITDWDSMEQIWNHTFSSELCIAPEETPVFLTQPILNPKPNKEKTVEVMFESFDVPATYLAADCVLSIYCTGKVTGIAVDFGEERTSATAVYEGYGFPHSVKTLNLGGGHITDSLLTMLNERGYNFESPLTERDLVREFPSTLHSQSTPHTLSTPHRLVRIGAVREVKEQLCFVALDFDQESEQAAGSSAIEKSYELPDGNVITVGDERFRCPEILFNSQSGGIHELTYDSIMTCDITIRDDLYNNIVLAGGSSMFEGLRDRMQKEITAYAPARHKVHVVASPERHYSAWIGGSILSSLTTFQEMWISKKEYEEEGAAIVHKKCIS